jgi:hypothetical protein
VILTIDTSGSLETRFGMGAGAGNDFTAYSGSAVAGENVVGSVTFYADGN